MFSMRSLYENGLLTKNLFAAKPKDGGAKKCDTQQLFLGVTIFKS